MSDRRAFLRQGVSAAALIAAYTRPGQFGRLARLGRIEEPPPDPAFLEVASDPAQVKALLMAAINAAQLAGAQYADARIQR